MLGAVAIIIPDGINQFFSNLAQLFQRQLYASDLPAIILDSDQSIEREADFLSSLDQLGVRGVVFVSIGDHPQAYSLLSDWQQPTLIVDREIELENADVIISDNNEGMRQVVEHLASLGHQRLGFVTGDLSTQPARTRREALVEYCDRFEMEVMPTAVVEGDFGFGSGREAARLIVDLAEKPTAIVCSNDLMALGLLQGLQERGISVPSSMSVVGYDDVPLATWVYPQITTVRQNLREMAEIGSTMLVARMNAVAEGVEQPRSRLKVSTPRLVERASSSRVQLSSWR
jgi:LacI family transcriptional regulator